MKIEELTKNLTELQGKLRTFLHTQNTKQLKNTREGRNIKRKIAVIKTILHQKEFVHEAK